MINKKIIGIIILIILNSSYISADINLFSNNDNQIFKSKRLKSINGTFYAYIVLLFNENPHFINLIQKDSITNSIMANEGFHIRAFKNYMHQIKNPIIKKMAKKMIKIYLEPYKFNKSYLTIIEKNLSKMNIIVKFSKDKNISKNFIILDYCIFGKKIPIHMKHPHLKMAEKIYNIYPFTNYDGFSTSNSTFYYDMIYINDEEIENDTLIAKKILNGEKNISMFYVGARITEDIRYCLLRAFKNKNSIRNEIWKMFVVHELTHKIINNKYNNYDQIAGEELSLSSSIYINPMLGISVLYSYLNYSHINPHRIAAKKFINYISKKTGNKALKENSSLLKFIKKSDLIRYSKDYFYSVIKRIK